MSRGTFPLSHYLFTPSSPFISVSRHRVTTSVLAHSSHTGLLYTPQEDELSWSVTSIIPSLCPNPVSSGMPQSGIRGLAQPQEADLSINWLLSDFTLQSFGFITSLGPHHEWRYPCVTSQRSLSQNFLLSDVCISNSSYSSVSQQMWPLSGISSGQTFHLGSCSNFYYFISGSLTLLFHLYGIIAVSCLSWMINPLLPGDFVLLIYFLTMTSSIRFFIFQALSKFGPIYQ